MEPAASGTGGSGTGGTGTGGAGTGGGGTGGTGTGGAGTGGGGTGGTGTGGAGTGGGGTGGGGGVATGGTGGVATGGTGGSAGSGGSGGTIQDSGVADIRRDATGAFSINCGTTTCDSTTAFCCLAEPNNFHCVGAGSTCPALTDRIHCDDTADCTAGQVCCLTDSTWNTPADAVCATGCASP